MASSGRISFLVSTELRTLLQALSGFDKEQRAQVRAHTKAEAAPIWQEEVRGRSETRAQVRVLSDSATVAVSDSNVLLRSASAGRTSGGTPKSELAHAVEFGSNPKKIVNSRSKKDTAYKRKQGNQFGPPRRRGYVVFPAARDSIPRFASLWVQTTIRTLHEILEKGGAR